MIKACALKISIHPVDLHLKNRFTTHVDSRVIQHSHIITLEHEGFTGIGEVTAHPFYNITRAGILSSFDHVKNSIEQYDYDHPDNFWELLSPLLSHNLFLLSGIDVASHDLYGKIKSKSVYELYQLPEAVNGITSYTIGIDETSVMVDKLLATPWPLYKIKLGTERDVEIIKALRKITNTPFRIDANCGWDLDQLTSYTTLFKKLNIDLIEQAFHPTEKEKIKAAKAESKLPLIADESFKTMDDLAFCAKYYDGINIKLVKCGGLTPAIKIAARAKVLGLKIMIGCMTESSIGISAASQLAGIADYLDLDGALLLKKDIAEGTKINNGKVIRSGLAGIGCSLL